MAALTKGLRTKQEKYSFKYDYHITDIELKDLNINIRVVCKGMCCVLTSVSRKHLSCRR